MRHQPLALALVLATVISGGATANMLSNGSLTGPIFNGGVPSGWLVLAHTPDTMDETHNVGVTSVPFQSIPSGPSPDGGTWVGIARDGEYVESFGQTVTGLASGATYELSWFAGNFGAATGPNYIGTNAFEVLIDGTPIGSGSPLASSSSWSSESLSFVAPAASLQLAFRLRNDTRSYLSIDGITLQAAATVTTPEPTSLGLLVAGLLGLAGLRRRR